MAGGSRGADGPAVRVSIGTDERPERATALLSAARDAPGEVNTAGVGPTGAAGLAPLVMVTMDGTTAFHADPSADRIREFVASFDAEELPTAGAHAVVEHDPGTTALPVPETGPLAAGRRRALARCGWTVPATKPHEPIVETVLDDPDTALERVRSTGLFGRGRGDGRTDAAVATGWETARDTDGEPVVVVNANDGDPSVNGDRTLLEGTPTEILDGALAVAGIVGAADVIVYLNGTDDRAATRVRGAADAIAEAELDGEATVQVVSGPDEYVAGEMTMALEAMEGNDRLEARLRPPAPAEVGLYGRPTVIHTPRTLAQVRALLADPAAIDGSAADPGTRLVTVAGDDTAGPTTVELPTDVALADAAAAAGTNGFKMACVGGRFGGITRSLDVPASAPALGGAGLGTEGAVELFDGDTCALALAGSRAKFAREENCGRCVPCREGSKQLVALLRGIYDGTYDGGELRELSRVVGESSICEFGRAAPRPVTTAMAEFESEIAAHAEGRCPSGVCAMGD